MAYTDTRIAKLRQYLFGVVDTLSSNNNYQINANMLGKDGDYSLDKIPTSSTIEKWVDGTEIHGDVFSFRSRKTYSQDTINNLKNIGFFESFEEIIKSNNKEGVLPDIEGIQSIECLSCGTLIGTDGTEATFDIQIQITYKITNEKGGGTISL